MLQQTLKSLDIVVSMVEKDCEAQIIMHIEGVWKTEHFVLKTGVDQSCM